MSQTLPNMLENTISKIKQMVDVNSVIGNPITTPDGVTIIPISKVSIGFAGGGSDVSDRNKGKYKNPAGTGAGISDTPQGFLVVKDGDVHFLSVNVGPKSAAGDIISTIITEAKALINGKKEAKES